MIEKLYDRCAKRQYADADGGNDKCKNPVDNCALDGEIIAPKWMKDDPETNAAECSSDDEPYRGHDAGGVEARERESGEDSGDDNE